MPAALLKTAGIFILAASPQSPAAVVEDIAGAPPGIQFMDYAEIGEVIKLSPQDRIVLGYLKSCWHETITGGTVTVGAEQSEVQDGTVDRFKVACEGGKMLLTAELAAKSGAMVFRDQSRSTKQAAPQPQFTVYGRSPIIEVRPGGSLVIDRVDKPGEHQEVVLNGENLIHGTFLDLAKAGVALAAGGIYRAQAGRQEIVFKIDTDAQSGQTPIVGRLLRLQPAN
jgi:hypothetical protein